MDIAVLISGRGSNMNALLDAAEADEAPFNVVQVISNRPKAAGIEIARDRGIPVEVIDHTDFESRAEFDDALSARLTESGAQLICLAGFMRLLTADFVNRWRDRVVNIHPSLLPAFRGLNTHERVIAAGVRISGCTVHFLRPELDEGPIIVQAAVPVDPADTADDLADRVLAMEHKCYPLAVRWIAEGRVRITGETARIEGAEAADLTLLNPNR